MRRTVKSMRDHIFIIAMGLLLPMGIIVAGSSEDPAGKWLGYLLSVVGAIGVVAGMFRQHESRRNGRESRRKREG